MLSVQKDKDSSSVKSEARMPAVYRAHHNARILCVMEHPTLKMRQNASILLDVQCELKFIIYIYSKIKVLCLCAILS